VGVGSGVGFVLATVGRQWGSITKLVSYNVAICSGVSGGFQASGSSVIFVVGNFLESWFVSGFSARGITALTTQSWTSSSAIALKSSPGVGKFASLVLTPVGFAKVASNLSSGLGFSNFGGTGTAVNTSLGFSSATGGALLAINGQEFGIFGSTARLRCFSTPFETSFWLSSSSLACKKNSFSGGVSNGSAIVSVASIVGGFSGGPSFIYPALSALSITSLPNSGAAILFVFGSDLGIRDSSVRSRIAGLNVLC